MGADQNGHSFLLVQIYQQSAELVHSFRIKTVNRFIQDQQVRASQKSHGDSKPLLHSHRITLHQLFVVRIQSCKSKKLPDLFVRIHDSHKAGF